MLGKEAGRVSFVGGRIKKVFKGGKTAAKAVMGTKAAKKGARAVKSGAKVKRSGGVKAGISPNVEKARYVYDVKSNRYRDLKTGKYIAQSKLPYPSNSGFKYSKKGKIKPGTEIDRFGDLDGRYAGNPGASISQRGMPAGSEKLSYKKFKVVKEIPAEIGPAAGVLDFGASGGATQYRFKKPLKYYLDNGYIKEMK